MMRREFEEKYRKNLEDIRFPEILKGRMKCICCLKERQNTRTLLVSDEENKYILKMAEGNRIKALEREKDILEALRHSDIFVFPEPGLFITEEGTAYYLREYVEGETLLTIVKKHGRMSEPALIYTGIQICRLLELLHSQNPPVMHRDIKPENIILKKDRTFTLIDFETARWYKPGKLRDTMLMASRPTAAPEQYGFGQTDCRTDVYGLGMTLLYLACGSYDRRDLKSSGLSIGLQRIIRKALRLNIDRRYRTALKLRKRLERHQKRAGKFMCNRRSQNTGNDTKLHN